jgi:hypothetical protein
MRRITAILLALAFAVGTLVLPALHQAHCADAHAGPSSSPCPICQLANAPLTPSAAEVEPVGPPPSNHIAFMLPRLMLTAVSGGSAQARAPPVA